MELVKCNKCKWVHFEMDPPEYPVYVVPKKCFKCGNSYKDFSKAEPTDVRDGSTIQSILRVKK